MRLLAIASLILLLGFFNSNAQAQPGDRVFDRINLLTDPNLPFPPGCLSITLPDQPSSQENVLANRNISVPTTTSNTRDGRMNVLIWRVACPDDAYSVIMIRLTDISNEGSFPILVPETFIKRGEVFNPFPDDLDQYIGRLQILPAGSDFGAEGTQVSTQGSTFLLGVERFALGDLEPVFGDEFPLFIPEFYNDELTLEFTWLNYSRADSDESYLFQLDRFIPEVDPPQFDEPVLNGRYSGQWVVDGAERQGLVLQIGEQFDDNFVYAIFFTYLDEDPVWVIGNTGPEPMNPGPVTIDMILLDGGAFITSTNQPPADAVDIENVGQITIEVVDCNTLSMDYDFRSINQGTGTLTLRRFIDLGGYDCNPWE